MRVFIAVVAIAAVASGMANSANAQAVVDGSSAGLNTGMVEAAIATATKELRDPSSAQFKGLRLIHTSAARPEVICGYVNAKNGFGGYAGFKPFYYDVKANKGGVVHLAKDDAAYPMQHLPLEWTGCAKALGE